MHTKRAFLFCLSLFTINFAHCADEEAKARKNAEHYTRLAEEMAQELKLKGLLLTKIELFQLDQESVLREAKVRIAHYKVFFENVAPITISYIVELRGKEIRDQDFKKGVTDKILLHANSFVVVPDGIQKLPLTVLELSTVIDAKAEQLKKFNASKSGTYLASIEEYFQSRFKQIFISLQELHIGDEAVFEGAEKSLDKLGIDAQVLAIEDAGARLEKIQYELGKNLNQPEVAKLYHGLLLARAYIADAEETFKEYKKFKDSIQFKTTATEGELLRTHQRYILACQVGVQQMLKVIDVEYKDDRRTQLRDRLIKMSLVISKLHLYGLEVPQHLRLYGHGARIYGLQKVLTIYETTMTEKMFKDLSKSGLALGTNILSSIAALETELRQMRTNLKGETLEKETARLQGELSILKEQYTKSLTFMEKLRALPRIK